MMTLEELSRSANFGVDAAQQALVKFTEKLKENPADALEWSTSEFEAAAQLRVWKHVSNSIANRKSDLTPEETVMHICGFALRSAIDGARWPRRSTAPASNLLAQCVTSAWAQLYCDITERM